MHNSSYLCHYGVKGMRWGIRKSRSTGTRQSTGHKSDVRYKASSTKTNTKTNGTTARNQRLILATTVRQALNSGASMATSQALLSISTGDPAIIATRTLGGLALGMVIGGVTGNFQAKYQNTNTSGYREKETSLRDNEYLDDHGDVRDKKTGKMVYN